MKKFEPGVEEALRRGKRKLLDAYRHDPNVTGAGVGFRFRNGEWTDEPVVTVLVAKKRPKAMVSRSSMLPETVEVDGKHWGVDVVQAGPFQLHHARVPDSPAQAVKDPKNASGELLASRARASVRDGAKEASATAGFTSLTQRVRPPLQGCSISNPADGKVAGTLGCLVYDPSDGTVCLLTCNHVIGRMNKATPGEAVIQPGGLDETLPEDQWGQDEIATFKRLAPLADGTEVDAAIAQLDDQTGYSQAVMNDLMYPISGSQPAVGMVVAGDASGFYSFLTRMDATFASLGVELFSGTPSGGVGASSGILAPQVGMNIQKVGRTTGYTSATVLGMHFDLPVNTDSTLGAIEYTELVMCMFFSLPGDSGSVACLGGSGNLEDVELFLSLLAACELLGALGDYYAIPLDTADNNTLADELRDNFLSQSKTGQLLIATTYTNTQVVIDRLNSNTGTAHNQSYAQARAQSMYSTYHSLAATLITSTSPTQVITSSEVDTVASIIYGLAAPVSYGGTAMLTSAESQAAWALYSSVLKPAIGMNRQQLISYMNEWSVLDTVYNHLAAVPTIALPGPVSAIPQE